LKLALEVERRGPAHLNSTQSQGGTFRVVLTELVDEFLEAARVFHLELFAAWSRAVDWRKSFRSFGFPAFGDDLDLLPELGRLVRLCAHTGCADNDRERAMRIVDTVVERGEAAHRQADDMRLVDLQMIEDVDRIVDCAPLRVFLHAVGNLRWRIAAGVERDAPITAREVANLELPGAIVA